MLHACREGEREREIERVARVSVLQETCGMELDGNSHRCIVTFFAYFVVCSALTMTSNTRWIVGGLQEFTLHCTAWGIESLASRQQYVVSVRWSVRRRCVVSPKKIENQILIK